MKIFLFPFLTLLAVQRSFGENICEDVTFDECDLDEGAPTDTLFTLDSIMCQEICQSFSNCNFFRFDRTASDDNCQLFEANYRDSCNIVAAPIYRDVNACLSNTENTCDKMMEETCQYSGKEIYDATPGTITDATDCGDLCIDFEQLECSYWKFDKNNETCTLFDSDNRSCNILSGPQEPSIESCEESISYCVSITTGPNSLNDGYVSVSINGRMEKQGRFDKNQIVLEECFDELMDISVQNNDSNKDAWAGTIVVKRNGKEAPLNCDGCEGIPFDKTIAVDGDSDGMQCAPTYCLNGKVCKLTLQGVEERF